MRAQKLEGSPEDHYDWRTDTLSDKFEATHVKSLLKVQKGKMIDGLLMNQEIFTGVGNIIRNEALYRAGIHPYSIIDKIPATKINDLIKAVVAYGKLFYKNLEKKGEHKSFDVYKQEYARDGSEVIMKVLPKTGRKIYFSEYKQKLYT